MKKIEEVARAIGGDVWESCSDRMKEQFRAQARAAIEAMREPNKRILHSLWCTDCTVDFNWTEDYKREVRSRAKWQSAIDAALAEGPK